MSDFVVKGRMELETAEFEQGVERAEAASGKLGEGTRRRNQYDQQATDIAKKAGTEAVDVVKRATEAADQATAAASRRAAAEQVASQAIGQANEAMRLRIANDNSAGGSAAAAGGGGLANTVMSLARAHPIIAATTAVVLSLGVAFAHVLDVGAESLQRQRQFTITLAATGNAAATTAQQLERLVQVEGARVGAGRGDTARALGGLLLNSNLDGDGLARTLAIARDYGRVTGQELPAASAVLSRALDGTSASARQLDLAYNFLTAAELAQIRNLEEHGNKAGVVAVVLAALERNFKGANENGVSPLTKGLNDLGSAWTTFETKVSKSEIVQALLKGAGLQMSMIAQTINGLAGNGPAGGAGNGATAADVQQARDTLAAEKATLDRLRAQREGATGVAAGYADAYIAKQEKRVAELQATVDMVSRQVSTTQINASLQAADAEAAKAASDTERKAKEFLDQLARLNTTSQQRDKLNTERDSITRQMSLGALSPQQLAAANDRLQQINGQLNGLATPLDKLQQGLDLNSKLAAIPAHLRAIEQAGQQALKAALDAGATPARAQEMADQARRNAATQAATATQQQIALLSAEAQGALAVADAYNTSRAAGIQAAAQQAAIAAEASGAIAPGQGGAFAQETLEKNAAAAVAAAAEKNRAYTEELAGLQRVVAAEAEGSEAAREAQRANRVATLAVQLRAQAEASGSEAIAAAAEKQIAVYERLSQQQLTLDRQRAAQQLNTQFDPQAAYAQRMAQLATLQATGRVTERAIAEATRQAEQARLDASRDATDGMIGGLQRYANAATNAGQAASQGIQQSFQTMENALVQFVTTGQLNFSQFANAIIADIARIAIRTAITGPIAAGLSSMFSGFFSGGPNAGGYATVGSGAGITNNYPNFMGMHDGGIVGRDVTFTRAVDPMIFANARRYHSGGMVLGADEVPIIAKRGERVLTEEEQRQWGGDRPPVVVNIINKTDSKVSQKQSTGAGGGLQLDVLVEQVEGIIADRMARNTGPMYGAISGTFGLQPQGRG